MDRKLVAKEIQSRIENQFRSSRTASSIRDISIAWDGYIAALLEWDLITPAQHLQLLESLPDVSDSPVCEIFIGSSQYICAS